MSGWSVITSSNTISSAMLDMTGLDLSSYKIVRGLITNATVISNDTAIVMQFYLAGSLVTSSYRYAFEQKQPGVGGNTGAGSGEAVMWISPWQGSHKSGNGATCSYFSQFIIHDPAGSGFRRAINVRTCYMRDDTHFCWLRGTCSVDNTGAVTGFRLKTFDGSGLATARLTLHGLT